MLPLRDRANRRASPGTKLVTKSVCFLALIAGAIVYNGFKALSSTQDDLDVVQRRLEEIDPCAKASGGGAGGFVIFYILVGPPPRDPNDHSHAPMPPPPPPNNSFAWPLSPPLLNPGQNARCPKAVRQTPPSLP